MDATKTRNRFVTGLRNAVVRRVFALLVLSLGAGAFVAEYTRVPDSDLSIGSVATRTIRANANFPFVDWAATLERQRAAEARVPEVRVGEDEVFFGGVVAGATYWQPLTLHNATVVPATRLLRARVTPAGCTLGCTRTVQKRCIGSWRCRRRRSSCWSGSSSCARSRRVYTSPLARWHALLSALTRRPTCEPCSSEDPPLRARLPPAVALPAQQLRWSQSSVESS